MALAPATRLGPYEILAPLASGGMGDVYRARDTRLNRVVALKTLPPEVADDPRRRQRFESEARAASALSHPNIVTVHDVGDEAGVTFMVSELVEGESLRALLARGATRSRRALEIAVQIADGMGAAHAAGIVHRDLKPENVMIGADGRVKILDFGLAKQAAPAQPDADALTGAQTLPGVVMGTVGYMAPEQVRGEPADHRSDIFSFGVILYEMLTGRRAFSGDTSVEVMHAILRDDPPELPASLPPAVDQVVRHCLEKDPRRRFQSAQDLAFGLEALLRAGGTSGSGAAPALAARRPGRRWLRWAGLAAAGLALVVGGYVAGGWQDEAPTLKYHRLTFRRGRIHAARFAPDGSVVYSAAWESEPSQLFSARGDGPESLPLGFSGAGLLAVSRSSELALALNLEPANTFVFEGLLARAPFSGGAPRPLVDRVETADFSPDGTDLVIVRRGLAGAQVEMPPGKVLHVGPTGGFISNVRVSPDGARLAFLEHAIGGSDGQVVVLDRNGGKKALTDTFNHIDGLAWGPRSDEVWFSAAVTGARTDLRAVTLDGRQRVIATQAGMLTLYDVSRDGRVLLGTGEFRSRTVFLSAVEGRERDLSWLDWSVVRDLSPDGKLIVFDESGEGAGTAANAGICYVRDTSGAPAVKLGEGSMGALSPDGQSVVAVSGAGDGLIVFPLGPGQTKQVPLSGLALGSVQWLPGGRDVLVSASEPGKGPRIYRVDFMGGRPRPITAEGVSLARGSVSPDGKYAAGVEIESGQTRLFPVDGGAPKDIAGLHPGERVNGWNQDGGAVFAVNGKRFPLQVTRIDLRTGGRELVKDLTPSDLAGVVPGSNVHVTPDGRHFSYNVAQLSSVLFRVDGLR